MSLCTVANWLNGETTIVGLWCKTNFGHSPNLVTSRKLRVFGTIQPCDITVQPAACGNKASLITFNIYLCQSGCLAAGCETTIWQLSLNIFFITEIEPNSKTWTTLLDDEMLISQHAVLPGRWRNFNWQWMCKVLMPGVLSSNPWMTTRWINDTTVLTLCSIFIPSIK